MNPEEFGDDTDEAPQEYRDVPVPPLYQIQNPINQDDLELTCLKVKLQSAENKNLALSMELKCAQLQMNASEQLNQKRQDLINMLELKVKKLSDDKHKLLDMVEDLLKEKTRYTSKLNDAANTLDKLTDKFIKSEKSKRELQNQINGHLMPDTGPKKTESQTCVQGQIKPNSAVDNGEIQGQKIGANGPEVKGQDQCLIQGQELVKIPPVVDSGTGVKND